MTTFHDDDLFQDAHLFEQFPGSFRKFLHCDKEWKVGPEVPPVYLCPVCEEAIAGQRIAGVV